MQYTLISHPCVCQPQADGFPLSREGWWTHMSILPVHLYNFGEVLLYHASSYLQIILTSRQWKKGHSLVSDLSINLQTWAQYIKILLCLLLAILKHEQSREFNLLFLLSFPLRLQTCSKLRLLYPREIWSSATAFLRFLNLNFYFSVWKQKTTLKFRNH